MAKKAVEMYDTDSAYRLLHDGVSDLFAHCLRSDIQRFNQLKSKSESESEKRCLEITTAVRWCPYVDSLFDCMTLISESIAKKVFQRISEEDEAEHAERARELLVKEVLLPLEVPLERPRYGSNTKENGYHYPALSNNQPCEAEEYLEEVKSGGEEKIMAEYLLPHEIIECVCDYDELREAAELQWKAMVKDVYSKKGKFKNFIAVCDVSGSMMRIPMDVGILVSEVSEEPWNGKVITFNRNPQMVSVQGDDLRSKLAFMRGMDGYEWYCAVDFQKVFDSILEVAVKGGLKQEQMIKRVFVFTIYNDFKEISANRWETDYEAIQRKFKVKGFVVPHLVVCVEISTPAA